MNKRIIVFCSALLNLVCLLPSLSYAYTGQGAQVVQKDTLYDDWLMAEFSEQHEKLIPIVAVADMFFACNQERKIAPPHYSISDLVLTVKRDDLANKLQKCLGTDTVKSDVAINFGLTACFNAQLAHLPSKEQQEKMALVAKAIVSLSKAERQKSFTQCVTDQAIKYLQ